MGRHLGIDFWSILVDFERQEVCVENRPKIDPKRHRKKRCKKEGHQDGQQDGKKSYATDRERVPNTGRGGRGRIDNTSSLNHPSPEGWWDLTAGSPLVSLMSHDATGVLEANRVLEVFLETLGTTTGTQGGPKVQFPRLYQNGTKMGGRVPDWVLGPSIE